MDDARRYIAFLQELGVSEVPAKYLSTEPEPVAEEGTGAMQPEPALPSPQDINPEQRIGDMANQVADCRDCTLSEGRTHAVFGEGSLTTDLMFIGEGPGFDEDQQGIPFVGKAGQLLTKIIHAIELNREDVYITNIVKCRPPRNRDPLPEEVAACWRYLEEQIRIIQPKVICTLGRHSSQTLLNTTEGISRLRGRFHNLGGIKVMPTYHPAYLLRNPAGKRDVWQDMQRIRDYLRENSDLYERTTFDSGTGARN